jgi:hypothetical protein
MWPKMSTKCWQCDQKCQQNADNVTKMSTKCRQCDRKCRQNDNNVAENVNKIPTMWLKMWTKCRQNADNVTKNVNKMLTMLTKITIRNWKYEAQNYRPKTAETKMHNSWIIFSPFMLKWVFVSVRLFWSTWIIFQTWKWSWSGLPDFSWCNIPKRDKIYQITTEYSRWLQNMTNRRKIDQMAI